MDDSVEARLRDARPHEVHGAHVTGATRSLVISAPKSDSPLSRRRRWMAVVAATIGLLIAAPVVALTTGVIEFDKAPRVSVDRQLRFNELVAEGAPPKMDPQVVPFSARYLSSFRRGAETVDLWVAPTHRGGFCYSFTNFTSGCRATRTVDIRSVPISPGEYKSWLIDLTTYRVDNNVSPSTLAGNVLAAPSSRLFANYANGQKVEIPVTWISAPINAGFFFAEIGADSQVHALEVEDEHGKLIARTASQFR